jgi:drug/metabolite transporter (DMT)-like permease
MNADRAVTMPAPGARDGASRDGTLLPRAAAFAAIVLWGVSFVATKAALGEVSPLTLVVLRFTLGVGLLHLLLAARGAPLFPERTRWPALALMGFVGVFVHSMLQAVGLTMTSAINTGWLIGVIPIWSAILSFLFRGERFGPIQLLGLVLGFAGALLVVTRGASFGASLALPSTKGDLLILASTLNWAVYTILGHGTIRALGALPATAASMLFGWAMLLPFFVARESWYEIAQLTSVGWGAILFLGIGCSALGYLFWYGALEKVEAGRVASFIYFEPLVTLTAAAILLKEPVTWTSVIGGVVVLAGVVLVQRARR